MITTEAIDRYLLLQFGGVDEGAIGDSYEKYCTEIANAINPPQSCHHLVDIGGGLGGPSLLLALRTGATLHIVDGDDSDGIAEKRCQDKPFNSFSVTEQFLNANGLQSERIRFHHLSVDGIPEGVDLVTSFAAWGFHFPLEQYLPIIGKIRKNGRLVIELRVQKNEIEKLKPWFTVLGQKQLTEKKIRYVLRRNATPF